MHRGASTAAADRLRGCRLLPIAGSRRAAGAQRRRDFRSGARIAAGFSAALPNRSAMDGMGIALSGMQSAQTRVAVSAHNVANLLTEGFHPQRAAQTSLASGGSRATVSTAPVAEPVDLDREVVDQIVAKTQYAASARVLGVELDLKGSLLDILA